MAYLSGNAHFLTNQTQENASNFRKKKWGFEPRWGRDFPGPYKPATRPHRSPL
jgi:hypothetical protein